MNQLNAVEPSAVEPSAVEPSAIEGTAIESYVITREGADRALLFELFEAAGWQSVGFYDAPCGRIFESTAEPLSIRYDEVPSLGLRTLYVFGPLPAFVVEWGAPVPLETCDLDPCRKVALRCLYSNEIEPEALEALRAAALDDDPRVYRTVLNQPYKAETITPILETLAERFPEHDERGAYARGVLSAMNPSDQERALRVARDLPTNELIGALRDAYHGGDAWLTITLAARVRDVFGDTIEGWAMHGDACRHLGWTWMAAVDLLAARYLAHEHEEREPDYVAPALDALYAELSIATEPMSRDLVSHIDEILRHRPSALRAALDALAPLPHGQTAALASRVSALALADADFPACRAAARVALELRPDDASTMAVLALAAERDAADTDDEALALLEEAWRRMVLGPIDAEDDAQLAFAIERTYRVSLESIGRRRLDALKARGLIEEQIAFGEQAFAQVPWSIEIGVVLGIAYTKTEDHERAIETYGKVIEYAVSGDLTDDPNVALCYFNRACERGLGGDHEGALSDLEEAIRGRGAFAAEGAEDDYLASLRGDARFEALCRGEIERRPVVIEGALQPIAKVLIDAEQSGLSREVMGDAFKRAVRGQEPPAALARLPHVPEALAAFGYMLAHPDLMILGPMSLEVYAAGIKSLDETFASLAPLVDAAMSDRPTAAMPR